MSLNYLVHIGDIDSTKDIKGVVNANTEYKIYNAFKYTDTDGTYTIQKPIRSTNDGSDGTDGDKLAELINLTSVPADQFLMKFAADTESKFKGTINNDQAFTYDGKQTITLTTNDASSEEDEIVVSEDIQGKPLPLIEILQELTSGDASVSDSTVLVSKDQNQAQHKETRRLRVVKNASSDGTLQQLGSSQLGSSQLGSSQLGSSQLGSSQLGSAQSVDTPSSHASTVQGSRNLKLKSVSSPVFGHEHLSKLKQGGAKSINSSPVNGGKRKTKSKRSSKKKRNTKKKRKTQNKKKSRKRSKK